MSRATRLLDRWAYFLQGTAGEPSLERATAWEWDDWQRVGPLLLARERRQVGDGEPRRIHFPVLAVLDRIDERALTDIWRPLPDGAPPAANR